MYHGISHRVYVQYQCLLTLHIVFCCHAFWHVKYVIGICYLFCNFISVQVLCTDCWVVHTSDGPNVLWCELKLPPRISEKYKSFTHYLKDSETGSNRLHGNMNGNSVESWWETSLGQPNNEHKFSPTFHYLKPMKCTN